MKKNRKPISLRLSPETFNALQDIYPRAGFSTRTALIEFAIFQYCNYLAETTQTERNEK